MKYLIVLLAPILLAWPGSPSRATASTYSSAKSLLLPARSFPGRYHVLRTSVTYTVRAWDGGIAPVMAIDERYGWMQGAEEDARDPAGRDVSISAQIFDTPSGARGDFGQFFTNSHPQSVYLPGTYWLGGTSVHGMGDRATLYRIEDDSSRCPQHLTTGLSVAFRNAILSVQVCTLKTGKAQALQLGKLLLRHARSVH